MKCQVAVFNEILWGLVPCGMETSEVAWLPDGSVRACCWECAIGHIVDTRPATHEDMAEIEARYVLES